MSKIAVIYYSATGNTAAMAEALANGAEALGAEVDVYEVSDFLIDSVDDYDGFAFGCPASGNEELEEYEFEPVFSEVVDVLGDRPIVLFGSYGDGNGEWMDNWEEECDDMDLNLIASGLRVNEEPDDDDLDACMELGELLVEYAG